MDEIIKTLSRFKKPPEYDENGDQCYKLLFFGTLAEYEALKISLTKQCATATKTSGNGDKQATRKPDLDSAASKRKETQ